MIEVDFNSDMGEGFGAWTLGDGVDDQLLDLVSSANIATGFHAGDPSLMQRTVLQAKARNVAIGAHPGYRDLVGFGRRPLQMPADELVADVVYQLGALREFARLHGLRLQHLKPHGALFMHLARDEAAARLLVETLQRLEPGLLLYCLPDSATWRIGRELGQPLVREFYADRDYDASGSIVLVRRMGALDPQAVAERVLRACQQGRVATVEGGEVEVAFESICLHSDTPGALGLAQAIRQRLQAAGIAIRAPGAS